MTRPGDSMATRNNKLILIIEDSADLQSLLGQLFESEGYVLSHAFDGQQALEMLSTMPELPSLILLDIMMPVMDGFEFRENQKKDPRINTIPVIMMTADSDPQAKAARLGVEHFFKKPIRDIDKLIDLAATLVNSP